MDFLDVVGHFETLALDKLGPLLILQELQGVGLRLNGVSDLFCIGFDWRPKVVRDKATDADRVLDTGLDVLDLRQGRVLVEPR